MPTLNWRDRAPSEIQVLHESSPQYETRVVVSLADPDWKALLTELAQVFSEPGSELRLALPSSWTLYWKLREGESRILLAHPEPDSWVGTIALNPTHAEALLKELGQLSEHPVSIIESGVKAGTPVARLSNLDVILKRA